MPLVSGTDVLKPARRDGYAVPAFSIHTPEMVDAVFAAAEHLRSPLLLQVGRRTVRQSGVEEACAWVRQRAARSPVPAALHLDHSQDIVAVLQGLRAGCTSVMYDGSDLPFAENVRRTREVVAACHAVGVPVEAEVGRVSGVEDDLSVDEAESRLATPDGCRQFVEATECDTLAPAVGSVHGLGSGPAHLHIDLIRAIGEAIPHPLVLHGGSGLDPEQLRAAIAAGISKVNLDTELRRLFGRELQAALAVYVPQDDPRPALIQAEQALTAAAEDRIRQLGSEGRA